MMALKIRKQFTFGNFAPEEFHSSVNRAQSPPVLAQQNMSGPPPCTASNGPPEGQTYCLRWNNHKSNLIEILDTLIKVESYVDCTIVVDDQVKFKAHRVVLAANSPYFQSILQDLPMDHCSIIFPGVKAFEMRALLEYMYTGEVNVTQSQIPKIMRIAEELEVKGLFDMADLKEKFNRLSDDNAEISASNSFTNSSAPLNPYSSVTTTQQSPTSATTSHKPSTKESENYRSNSSYITPTSSNISPSAAPSSSSSPPYSNYKSPYSSFYTKSPGPNAHPNAPAPPQTNQPTPNNLTPKNERCAQWPLSPSAAAAAMLSSVYESAPDMNPLKRKKLSSMSSMLMNRDTPILRNVLAQANPADSSQQLSLLLPNAAGNSKVDKASNSEKNLSGHNNNHSLNGSDYGDKKYQDEPHSPFTDRSFEDDNFESKGSSFGANFGNNANQKPEWKRYKQYTRSDIMSAIQCVREGMSALQASRKFGVPSRTLYDKVKKLGITTGRPMNRTMKRSPSNVESSAAFPYAHGYGQASAAAVAMHEAATREERELKEHHNNDQHLLPTTIPHPAAALLDHAFLQQALEHRGGGDIAGREALHAMALAAAAHAAANRMSTSPGPNGNAARSPSPTNFALKYGNLRHAEQELMERHELERECDREREFIEKEKEAERDMERECYDEDDHVEDLSVARKDINHSILETGERPETPYLPEVPVNKDNEKSVIMTTKLPSNPSDDAFLNEASMTPKVVIDDVRAD